MSSSASEPVAAAAAAGELDERDAEPRTPMKRFGSTRKLAAFSNIRAQLGAHTRVLESRAEAAAGVAGELHEYCRRRAELEHEYARALEKLARGALQRHREQRTRRDHWPQCAPTAYACWQAALEHTRALGRDHAALALLYAGPLAARTQRAAEDVLRLHRRCRELVLERHEEVSSALAEAAAAGKEHTAAAAAWQAQALKLRAAHDARKRLPADPPRHKKAKALDKELEKRRARYSEARGRALRARAEYVMALEAANATLQRYYLDDVADIMVCASVGFEAVVGRAARTAAGAEAARGAALAAAGSALAAAAALDPAAARPRALAAHADVLRAPPALPYAGAAPQDQDAEVAATLADAAPPAPDAHGAELAARVAHLEAAASALRLECHESAKTLDAAEAELVRQMEGSDEQWDVSGLFGRSEGTTAGGAAGGGEAAAAGEARRAQEDYYLQKFRAYVASAGRLARLEGRASAARALAAGGAGAGGRGAFAAPLDPRLGVSAQAALPAVLTSCVRVLAARGPRHQGVFRVSGSQVEVQALRAAFERGEQPLARARDASDVNSVCGLLKLWLREVRPPLLGAQLQDRLVRLAALPDEEAFVARMGALVRALPPPALVVLRYLFAFLAHLAAHSDHNMMDAWNLAICVGPTLLAAWGEGGGQVAAQNLVNELVKRTIQRHRDIFPQDLAPHTLFVPPPPREECEEEEEEDETEREKDGVGEGDDAPDAADDLSLLDDDDEDDELDEDQSSEEGDARAPPAHEPAERGAAHEHERENEHEQHEQEDSSESLAASVTSVTSVTTVTSVTSVTPVCRRLDSTPDLVLDLPARAAPGPAAAPTAAPLDAADTFLHNRDTLKKRPAHRPADVGDSGEAEGSGEGEGDAEAENAAEVDGEGEGVMGSPVPARNTARVAAKFAELTLTGGSRKPTLPAKPQQQQTPQQPLRRRPTPHPHARAGGPALAPAPPPRDRD